MRFLHFIYIAACMSLICMSTTISSKSSMLSSSVDDAGVDTSIMPISDHSSSIDDDQQTAFRDIVPVMLADASFAGKWKVDAGGDDFVLFNGFKKREGHTSLVFLVEVLKNNTKVQVLFEDDDFIDGKKAWIQFNLTNTNKELRNKSIFFLTLTNKEINPDYRLFHGESMGVELVKTPLKGNISMFLTSAKNRAPYNLSVNDTRDLQISLSVQISTLRLSLTGTYVYDPPKSVTYISYLAICLVCGLLICLSLFVSKRIDHMDLQVPALDNMGCFSMVLVSALYFQYFGFFVMLALQNYTTSSAWAIGVICFTLVLYTTCSYKIAFIIFLHKYYNHPQIHLNGFRSPKGKFLLCSMMTIMLSYILTVLFIRHYSYSLMLILYNTYPVIKVIETMFSPSKNAFSFKIHVITWFPCLIFGTVIRGFNNTLVQLRPFPGFTVIVSSMYVFGLTMTFLQSKLGTRFFLPQSCSPGMHQLLVDRSKLSPEILDDDCVICLHTLRLTPEEISMIDSNSESPLAGDAPIMKTRCNHYYHADCLINWLTVKSECPTCRHDVNVF